MTTPPWCREKVMVYYYYCFKYLGSYVTNYFTKSTVSNTWVVCDEFYKVDCFKYVGSYVTPNEKFAKELVKRTNKE